jgi:hypothetical protein
MKRTRLPILLLAPAALALAACQPGPTSPTTTSPGACRGTIGAVTVEDVIVPQGATCTLEGTRVRGNVEVKRDATLIARGVRVDGNVQAENQREVRVGRSSVLGGNVQAKQGARASVNDTIVGGDIQYEQNRGSLEARRNRVGGNIQVFTNRGSGTTNVIEANRVDGNLQCKENAPAPTGGGNVVRGSKEDQCRRL